jgi:ribosomal protein S18 acetylase RimI-like enzyme
MKFQHPQISRVGIHEALALQDISRLTFIEAFAEQNSEENMRQYLETALSLETLTAELSDPGMQFYFARLDNSEIGYLKVNLSHAQTELQDARALEIERIYVLKAYYGQQVAQLLYGKALQLAQEAGLDYIWLGVWEENHRAIRFYEKLGFVAFDKHMFKLGDDAQTDIMMKLDLRGFRTLPENQP